MEINFARTICFVFLFLTGRGRAQTETCVSVYLCVCLVQVSAFRSAIWRRRRPLGLTREGVPANTALFPQDAEDLEMTQVWDEGSAGRVRVQRWRLDESSWARESLDFRRHLQQFRRRRERRGKRINAGAAALRARRRVGSRGGDARCQGANATDTPWGNYDEWGPLGQENSRRKYVLERLRKPDEPWNATMLDLMELLIIFEEEEDLKREEEQFAKQNRRVDALIESETMGDPHLQQRLRVALTRLARRAARAGGPHELSDDRRDGANATVPEVLVSGQRQKTSVGMGGRHAKGTRGVAVARGHSRGSAPEDGEGRGGGEGKTKCDGGDEGLPRGQEDEVRGGVRRCGVGMAAEEGGEECGGEDDETAGVETMDSDESEIALLKGVPGQVSIHGGAFWGGVVGGGLRVRGSWGP